MKRFNLYDFKTHLSKHLALVEAGETILICKRNVPIAEIRPVTRRRTEKRPIGLAKGRFRIPDAFFEPLDEELISGFEGSGS